MPEFSEPIKDLISKMLKVEPSERITLDQIKMHPAFVYNFPQDYIVPKPLPLIDPEQPINIESLDPSILSALSQVGFSDYDELKQELISNENNIEKALTRILIQNFSFDSMAWSDEPNENEFSSSSCQCINLNPNYNINKDFIEDSLEYNFSNNNLSISKREGNESSESFYSFSEDSLWFSEMNSLPENSEHITHSFISNIPFSLELIFKEVQQFLNHSNFKWFYPNEFLIIGQNKIQGLQITILGSYTNNDNLDVNLEVKLIKGVPEDFQVFANQLIEIIKNLPNI